MFCLYCKKDNINIDSGEYNSMCEECSAEYVECNMCAKTTHMDYLVYRPDLFGLVDNHSGDHYSHCELCYNCESMMDSRANPTLQIYEINWIITKKPLGYPKGVINNTIPNGVIPLSYY